MSPVGFPVRAQVGVAGSISGWGTFEWQPIDVSVSHHCFSPSLSPSHPLSLKINKIFTKIVMSQNSSPRQTLMPRSF